MVKKNLVEVERYSESPFSSSCTLTSADPTKLIKLQLCCEAGLRRRQNFC